MLTVTYSMSHYHRALWTILVYACSNPKCRAKHFWNSDPRVTSTPSLQNFCKGLPGILEKLKTVWCHRIKHTKSRNLNLHGLLSNTRGAWLNQENLLESVKSNSTGYQHGVCPPCCSVLSFFFFKQQHGLNFSGLTSHWAAASCPFLSACHVTQCNVALLCNGLRHVMPMTCQPCEFQRDTVQWKTWFSNCPGGFKP